MNLKKGDKLVIMAKGQQLILQKTDLLLKNWELNKNLWKNMLASEEALKKGLGQKI